MQWNKKAKTNMRKAYLHYYVLFLIGIFLSSNINADRISDLKFIPIQSGMLPSNEDKKLYQDSEGYVWLATYNGLVRFDGYNVITYGLYNGVDEFFKSYLNSIVEDDAKNLWIATNKGLYKLNKPTGKLSYIQSKNIKQLDISSLVYGKDGELWIGGDKGLFVKQKNSDIYKHIYLKDHLNKSILHISSLMEDTHQNLWITAWEQGLFRYDIRHHKLYSYIDNVLYSSNIVFEDMQKNIWVGTWGKGLLKLLNPYTERKMQYKQYSHGSNKNSLLDNIIYDVNQDNAQHIWVGSRSGLSILHNESNTNSFENFVPNGEYGTLPYNEVNSILRTKDGLMWISMFGGGVCMIQAESEKYKTDNLNYIKKRYKTNSINSICYAGNNEYWMGIPGFGMIKYNMKTHSCMNYTELPDFHSMPYTSAIIAIIKRKKTNEYCFGTWNAGLWIYDEQRHKVKMLNHTTNKKYKDDCTLALKEDSENNLWIGTREGVYILDSKGHFYTLSEWLHYTPKFSPTTICNIQEDKNKNIWIATNYEGVAKINLRTRRYKIYTIGNNKDVNNTLCLLADSRGRIWVGTMWNGLARYQASTDSFVLETSISTINNKGISNIIEDKNGRIWITTHNAILSFKVNNSHAMEEINYYAMSKDLSGFFFNKNASIEMPDGSLVFGCSHGIRIFPTNMTYNKPESFPLAFTDFRIHNESLRELPENQRRKYSEQDINYTKEITLAHDDNNFYIEFSLLNYVNPQENIYSYQLIGYDKKETVVDAQHHFASYNNLPPGTYTFKLKGACYGLWGNAEKTLVIHILSAPWLSWWAYTLYVIIFIALALFTYRFVLYRWRMEHAIQLSNLERQKIEEINHVKLQFFTNITHELMTPLSIIIASLENLKDDKVDRNSIYKIMFANARRLMRLIQQILEFRKAESGNLKISVSEGNISIFIKSCVDAFMPLVRKKELNFAYSCKPENIIGYFDSDKLDKTIYNLLSNASKYTPKGGKISVNITLLDDNILQIDIINTGELISKEKKASLFKRFYEGDYRKFQTIGTGIGLSLVKDLIEKHHGEINVISDETVGNCFRIKLPINKDAYQKDEIDETINNQALTVFTFNDLEKKEYNNEVEAINGEYTDYTILIVDDNEELCMLLSNLLKNYFHVEIAINGKEAIKTLESKKIDLIVSDIMMPEMSGIELCQFVKNKFEYCHIPVILLTAKSAEESQIEGYNSGADGYISKPCNFSLLFAQIMNLIKKQERQGADFRKQLVFDVGKIDYTSMDEDFIQRAINAVNKHIGDCDFGLAEFVAEMRTSRTVLTDKLKALTGLTPTTFILNIRLTKACKLLDEQKKIRISDLAYAVGFNDPKYFSTCFKKKFSLSPKEYINRIQEQNISI